ncbi:MAG TPA: hypothetical protein VJT71_01635 [Pyrinomonadaceae bacterium]|nr:hypothetical protein [Pyrinomonadaceae bacterium]
MQPDFSALFRRDKVTPLHFRVRLGPCDVHDLHFLSSYLHDARFKPDAVNLRGKRLTIDFERDCWELGHTEHNRFCELHIAKSCLSVTPVSNIRWEAANILPADGELWLEKIYFGAAHWEIGNATEVVLSAPHAGWKLAISAAKEFKTFRLDDKETPYLYSRRKHRRKS